MAMSNEDKEGNFDVKILVEDEFEGMCPGGALKEAEELCRELRREHLVSATVISVTDQETKRDIWRAEQ
jgi:hypothetical protein